MISPLPLERYVREILPQTHALWGGDRDLATYGRDLERLARTAYLRRQERFAVGLFDGEVLGCSCKLYDREIRWRRDGTERRLAATGIGAVFTPQSRRGRGYASLMIGALLDDLRARGRDAAYLFSDIHPEFYARLGFVVVPSRLITLRASFLDDTIVPHAPIGPRDFTAVRRCFEATDALAPWSFERTPVVWDWIRALWQGDERRTAAGEQTVRTLVRGRRGVLAYAIGRRVPRQDAFVLDDFGVAGDEGRRTLPPLLRAAAGDLTRVSGWLPPSGARDALARGTVRARKNAILMIAPLSRLGRTWQEEAKVAAPGARSDSVWPADHI